MATVTVTVSSSNANIGQPTTGSLRFRLNMWMRRASDSELIYPQDHIFTLTGGDNTSMQLESTTDATPSTRWYDVWLTADSEKEQFLGRVQISPTPTTQKLVDLLVATLLYDHSMFNVWNETPTGAIDGVNKVFTLAQTPVANTQQVFVSGVKVKSGDITWLNKDFTLPEAPLVGQWIEVSYQKI